MVGSGWTGISCDRMETGDFFGSMRAARSLRFFVVRVSSFLHSLRESRSQIKHPGAVLLNLFDGQWRRSRTINNPRRRLPVLLVGTVDIRWPFKSVFPRTDAILDFLPHTDAHSEQVPSNATERHIRKF